MESKQFSTSRGHVILVGDFLARYQPDALRYFICAAGPETSDADFTWAEFVQRTNSELVAGWGNLVNRTATMIAKSFGEIPPRGDLEPVDEAVLAAVRAGFETVGDLIGRHRQRAGDRRGDAGRGRGEQVPHRHRALQDEGRRRSASGSARCCTSPRSACSTATRCSRRSCRTPPTRCWPALGGEGEFMPMPRIEHVEELDPDDGAGLLVYPVITGDYSATPRWESRPVTVGATVDEADPGLHQARPVRGRRGARPAGVSHDQRPGARARRGARRASSSARAEARAEGAAQEKLAVARVEDVDAGGVPAPAVRPRGCGRGAALPPRRWLRDGRPGHPRRLRATDGGAHRVGRADARLPPLPRARLAGGRRRRCGGLRLARRPGWERLVVVGDSAGSALAIGETLRHPDRWVGQVQVYPFVDPSCASYDAGLIAAELPVERCRLFWQLYLQGGAGDAALHVLERESLAGQPPALVQLAEIDVLTPTGRRYAERLAADGVPVDLRVYPGVQHGFWRHSDNDQSGPALDDVAGFLAGLG